MATKNKVGAEQAAKVTLITLFLSLFAAFALVKRGKLRREFNVRPFDLALLGFATYRLGRLASYDKVTEPLRQPFTKTVPDSYGASKTVVPKGEGARRALGQLLSCPICSGTWIAAILVFGLDLAPGLTRVFLAVMSAIGVAELLNAATEALQWIGEARRKEVGLS